MFSIGLFPGFRGLIGLFFRMFTALPRVLEGVQSFLWELRDVLEFCCYVAGGLLQNIVYLVLL